jgi:hypothetical protein
VGGRVEGVRTMFEERVGLFGTEAVHSQPFHMLLDSLLTLPMLTDAVQPVETTLHPPPSSTQRKNRSFPSVSLPQPLTGWNRTSPTPSRSTSWKVRFFSVLFLSPFFVADVVFSAREACRNASADMAFGGLWLGDFGASFDRSMGRTVELKPDQEVRLPPSPFHLCILTFHSCRAATRLPLHVLRYSTHQSLCTVLTFRSTLHR